MSDTGGLSGCARQTDAAPYALHALDDQDTDSYRQHLSKCPLCPSDVAELQLVVALLAVTPPRYEAPSAVRQRVMEVVHSEARRLSAARPRADRPTRAARMRSQPRHRLALLAGLALALGLGIDAEVAPAPRATTIKARVDSHDPAVRARLIRAGPHAELQISGLQPAPPGRIYQVWLVQPRLPPQPTGTLFNVTQARHASADVPETLRGVRRILVTIEPPTGSPKPTSAPIMTLTLTPR